MLFGETMRNADTFLGKNPEVYSGSTYSNNRGLEG
jgi:hypothetical protein